MRHLVFALCFGAVACGGGALPGAKTAPGGEDLGSELEANAEEMERELLALQAQKKPAEKSPDADEDGHAGEEARGDAAPTDAPAEPGQSAPPPPVSAATNDKEDENLETSKRDRCRTACRALASMKRSEARICELTGEAHQKCSWARSRVKDAVGRVERAGCECKE